MDIRIKTGRDRGDQSGETHLGLVSFNIGSLYCFNDSFDVSDNGLSNGGGGGGSFNGINSVGSSGGYSGFKSSGGGYGDIGTIRKPTRLEALPASGPVKKKSVPLLNTMGTF